MLPPSRRGELIGAKGAYFGFVDAKVSKDPKKIKSAGEDIKRWEKYAG
jgi:hypothetical protein